MTLTLITFVDWFSQKLLAKPVEGGKSTNAKKSQRFFFPLKNWRDCIAAHSPNPRNLASDLLGSAPPVLLHHRRPSNQVILLVYIYLSYCIVRYAIDLLSAPLHYTVILVSIGWLACYRAKSSSIDLIFLFSLLHSCLVACSLSYQYWPLSFLHKAWSPR